MDGANGMHGDVQGAEGGRSYVCSPGDRGKAPEDGAAANNLVAHTANGAAAGREVEAGGLGDLHSKEGSVPKPSGHVSFLEKMESAAAAEAMKEADIENKPPGRVKKPRSKEVPSRFMQDAAKRGVSPRNRGVAADAGSKAPQENGTTRRPRVLADGPERSVSPEIGPDARGKARSRSRERLTGQGGSHLRRLGALGDDAIRASRDTTLGIVPGSSLWAAAATESRGRLASNPQSDARRRSRDLSKPHSGPDQGCHEAAGTATSSGAVLPTSAARPGGPSADGAGIVDAAGTDSQVAGALLKGLGMEPRVLEGNEERGGAGGGGVDAGKKMLSVKSGKVRPKSRSPARLKVMRSSDGSLVQGKAVRRLSDPMRLSGKSAPDPADVNPKTQTAVESYRQHTVSSSKHRRSHSSECVQSFDSSLLSAASEGGGAVSRRGSVSSSFADSAAVGSARENGTGEEDEGLGGAEKRRRRKSDGGQSATGAVSVRSSFQDGVKLRTSPRTKVTASAWAKSPGRGSGTASVRSPGAVRSKLGSATGSAASGSAAQQSKRDCEESHLANGTGGHLANGTGGHLANGTGGHLANGTGGDDDAAANGAVAVPEAGAAGSGRAPTLKPKGLFQQPQPAGGAGAGGSVKSGAVSAEKLRQSGGRPGGKSPSRRALGVPHVLRGLQPSQAFLHPQGPIVLKDETEEAAYVRLLNNRWQQLLLLKRKMDNAAREWEERAMMQLYNVLEHADSLRKKDSQESIRQEMLQQDFLIDRLVGMHTELLGRWNLLRHDYDNAISSTGQALEAAALRVPLVGGAKADGPGVASALDAASEVIESWATKVEEMLEKARTTDAAVAELTRLFSKNWAGLTRMSEILDRMAALEIEARSLRAHRIQLARERKRAEELGMLPTLVNL